MAMAMVHRHSLKAMVHRHSHMAMVRRLRGAGQPDHKDSTFHVNIWQLARDAFVVSDCTPSLLSSGTAPGTLAKFLLCPEAHHKLCLVTAWVMQSNLGVLVLPRAMRQVFVGSLLVLSF